MLSLTQKRNANEIYPEIRFHTIRLAKIQSFDNTLLLRLWGSILHTAGEGIQNGTTSLENNLAISVEITNASTLNAAIPLLGTYPIIAGTCHNKNDTCTR